MGRNKEIFLILFVINIITFIFVFVLITLGAYLYYKNLYPYRTCGSGGCDAGDILSDPQQECIRLGKEWKMFSNGCVDSCYLERNNDATCTTSLRDGCDCGLDECWNGQTCEAN